jgi:transcriptional regulator with XRE-family HTH domain
MYGNPQRRSASEVQDLRREGGRWLKEQREAAGLSQRQLAAKVGADYYTFISQLETGRGRIPPDRYRDWALALEVPEKTFVRELLRFYDPITYEILFSDE